MVENLLPWQGTRRRRLLTQARNRMLILPTFSHTFPTVFMLYRYPICLNWNISNIDIRYITI
jgi:hypothetical protein